MLLDVVGLTKINNGTRPPLTRDRLINNNINLLLVVIKTNNLVIEVRTRTSRKEKVLPGLNSLVKVKRKNGSKSAKITREKLLPELMNMFLLQMRCRWRKGKLMKTLLLGS
jgi:hypothetical protein